MMDWNGSDWKGSYEIDPVEDLREFEAHCGVFIDISREFVENLNTICKSDESLDAVEVSDVITGLMNVRATANGLIARMLQEQEMLDEEGIS